VSVESLDRPRLAIPAWSATNLFLAAAAATLVVVALGASAVATSVWPPTILLLSVAATLTLREWARAGDHAPLNAGVLYTAVIALYGTYPMLEYVALDGIYTLLNDPRLFEIQPVPEVVARLGWYYVAYAAAFVAAYFLASGGSSRRGGVSIAGTDKSLLWSVLLVFLVMRGFVLVADLIFAAPVTYYEEYYLRFSHLPLIAQQLLGHANGMLSVLGIALVAAACMHWRRLRWWVLGWLAFEFGALVVGGGSRTDFVLLILALTVSYHYLVRPISMRAMVLGGLALVGGFLALGAVRAFQQGGTVGAGLEILSTANEFESLFGNVVDIDRLVEAGRVDQASIGVAVYVGDLIGLVPRQLLPFEKITLPNWYVETFYPWHAEEGGGLAFGAIAESLVGAGPIDLVWRAALVGLLLGWVDRRVRQRKQTFGSFALYVWVLSNAYLMFRISMLALVPQVVYRVLPVALAIVVLADLLRRAGATTGNRSVRDDASA
jgi:hypothetical protein